MQSEVIQNNLLTTYMLPTFASVSILSQILSRLLSLPYMGETKRTKKKCFVCITNVGDQKVASCNFIFPS